MRHKAAAAPVRRQPLEEGGLHQMLCLFAYVFCRSNHKTLDDSPKVILLVFGTAENVTMGASHVVIIFILLWYGT